MTVTESGGASRAAIARAAAALDEAGIEDGWWDAEQLAAHVLGTSRGRLSLTPTMTAAQLAEYESLVGRRAIREPLQHLIGSVGFRYVDLAVGPGVFIPRPETEVVVGWAVEHLRSSGREHPLVVDLCSGSGVIPLAIANEVPQAVVHGVELDESALSWARRNADSRSELGDTAVQLHHSDIEHAVPELDGTVDLVISNPPYVAEHELDDVQPEVRDHDPHVALLAGPDGLDVIRLVSLTAQRLLVPGCPLVVEHSDRQGESVPELLRADGWVDVEDHDDLTGRPRFATAWKDHR